MSTTAIESNRPVGDPITTARRTRLAHLARIIFDLMRERYFGGTIHDYDGVEDASLIDALRACSRQVNRIGCLNFDELFAIEAQGVDGLDYMILFSLHDPEFSLIASRVSITKLTMLDARSGDDFGPSMTMNTMNVSPECREQLRPGRVTADRAFLIGMAKIIGFMDRPADDEGEGLMPLAEWLTPRREQLRQLRGKLPASTIDYDAEGDQPF